MGRTTSPWEAIAKAPLTRALAVYAGAAFAVLQGVDIFTNQLGLPDWVFVGTLVVLLLALLGVVATAYRYSREGRDLAAVFAPPHPGEVEGAVTSAEGAAPDGTASAGAPPDAAASDGPPARATTPAGPARAGAASSGRPRRFLTWRRLSWGGGLALAGWGVVVGGVLAMGSAGIGPTSSLLAAGVLDVRERVILADFESRTGDTSLAGAVTEAFRIDLAQSPVVTVVESGYVTRALERMQRDPSLPVARELAREIAVRDGIKAVIGGEIASVGGGFVLTAELVAAETGAILAGFRETAADSAALIPAIDRLSKRMRSRIGESLRSTRSNEALEHVTTSSLEALRKYSQAVRARDEGDALRARALLLEAVALDPEFAMAWRKLGLVAVTPAESNHALTRAYELRGRLTDRERYLTRGTYYAAVTHDAEQASLAYRSLLATYPNDAWALNNLAMLYTFARDYEQAEGLLLQAIAADSFSASSHTNLVLVRFAAGKADSAASALARFARSFPRHPSAALFQASLASANGEYDAAERRLREYRDARRAEGQVRLLTGSPLIQLATLRGRLVEADREAEELVSIARELGIVGPQLGVPISTGFRDILLRGDTVGALQRLDEALARNPLDAMDPMNRPYIQLAHLYAVAGRPGRASELLAGFEAVHGPDLRGEQAAGRESLLGVLALMDGRPLEAVERFRRADQGPCATCAQHLLGLAFDAANQPDSALVHYQRYVETPWLPRLQEDWLFLPIVYERMAELYEARGDLAAAREYHAHLVRLWEGADPELQPRVEAARRAVARLTREGR